MSARPLPTFALLCALPTLVAAADTIETITVVASRVPLSVDRATVPVEVLERDAIVARNARDVADLLLGHRGIAVSRAGGIGQFAELRMRGAESNHLQVRLDGVELNDPATGSTVDFAHIATTGLDRIEVLRGAQSALWGSAALAGVVALETTPSAGTERRTLGVERGTHDTYAATADVAASNPRGHYAFTARHLESDGTNVALHGNEADRYEHTTLHANVGFRTDATATRLVLRDVHARTGIDPTPFPEFVPVDGDLRQRVRQQIAGVDTQFGLDRSLQQRLFANLLESETRSAENDRATSSVAGRRVRAGYQVDWAPELREDLAFTLAGELTRETFHQRGLASPFGDPNQNRDMDTASAIAEVRARPVERLETSLSVRYDANSAFRDTASVRAAARASLTSRTALTMSAGTGTKNPTFTERFGYTPDTFYGNSTLDPERSVSLEAGAEHTLGDALTLGVAVYRDRLEDEIDGFVFDAARGAFTAQNRDGTSRRDGVEPWLRWQPIARLALAAQYTYLDATEPTNDGHRDEIRRPRHSAATTLDWRPVDRVSAQFGVAWIGARDDFDFSAFPARRIRLDAYTLLHCTARFAPTSRIELGLRAENLADAHYEDVFGYRTPGRTLSVTFEGRL